MVRVKGAASLMVALTACGCGGCGGREVVGEPEPQPASPADAGAGCPTAIRGEQAFAVNVSGSVEVSPAFEPDAGPPREVPVSFDLYFPQGRVSDAFAVLAVAVGGDGAIDYSYTAMVNGDASLTGNHVGSDRWWATLAGEGKGVVVEVESLTNDSAGRTVKWTGSATLCSAGEPAAPRLEIPTIPVGPLATLEIPFSAPINPSTLQAAVRGALTPFESEVGLRRDLDSWNISVRFPNPLPPLSELSVDFSHTRDVIGRPFENAVTRVPGLRTTTTLEDLTFGTPPPAGAVDANCGLHYANGMLLAGVEPLSKEGTTRREVLIALPGSNGARQVDVRFRGNAGVCDATVALVDRAGHGEAAIFNHQAGDSVRLAVPGADPLWLAIAFDRFVCPTNATCGEDTVCVLQLDEVTFVP